LEYQPTGYGSAAVDVTVSVPLAENVPGMPLPLTATPTDDTALALKTVCVLES
jgi:hypothetical protein